MCILRKRNRSSSLMRLCICQAMRRNGSTHAQTERLCHISMIWGHGPELPDDWAAADAMDKNVVTTAAVPYWGGRGWVGGELEVGTSNPPGFGFCARAGRSRLRWLRHRSRLRRPGGRSPGATQRTSRADMARGKPPVKQEVANSTPDRKLRGGHVLGCSGWAGRCTARVAGAGVCACVAGGGPDAEVGKATPPQGRRLRCESEPHAM